MYKTAREAVEFVQAAKQALSEIQGVEKVICPPFVCIPAVKQAIDGAAIGVGAQNMYYQQEGAYTGEVSPRMLQEWCEYVIIGHSERRQYFGETDESVNKKIKAALAHQLKPIVCVGETLELRRAGQTYEWVKNQVVAALHGIAAEQLQPIVIAYEPIWAIGTGVAATSQDAQDVIGGVVRPTIASMFGQQAAQAIRIQYGGSVKPSNAAELMGMPDIDGGLVGGASLQPADLVAIVRHTAAARS